ncbi:pentapeptide repeat-containing protein [Pannus brasiliensis CCIBt3594]|uniref:Pentapeptide repeat-containing protein n=1 Tax=Pannus brasiliensis CCIBt3594 TaxID=1427578 RepID=A0AAW9QKC4_9CHRO
MVSSSVAVDLQQRYQSGERQFSSVQLRGADLRGVNLGNADLSGADLSKANLREVNLSGANLAGAFLNEADLTSANLEGANLQGASLIKAYLIKTNLRSANLSGAYLTGAYLTKSNLARANVSGAYLNGIQLTGADLTEACYDRATRFDPHFDPRKMGLQNASASGETESRSKTTGNARAIPNPAAPAAPVPEVSRTASAEPETFPNPSVEKLLDTFNHLGQISARYLGATMTFRYWESSRPAGEALQDLALNRSAQFSWTGSSPARLTDEQTRLARQWIETFLHSCRSIIGNFPKLIDPQRLAFPVAGVSPSRSDSGTKEPPTHSP